MFLFLSNQRLIAPGVPALIPENEQPGIRSQLRLARGPSLFAAVYAFVSRRVPKKSGGVRPTIPVAVALAAVFFLWVFFPRVVLYPRQTFTYDSGERLATYLYPLGPGVVAKNEGEFWLHAAQTYKVVLGVA